MLRVDSPEFGTAPDLGADADSPAHARIDSWLGSLIAQGVLRPGDRLPSEIDIATMLGVSRMTLRQALASVESRGMLERRRGRFGGNFVTAPRMEFDLAGLPGFTGQLRRAHVEPGARVLLAREDRPDREAMQALSLKRGARIWRLVRVRLANGEPVALEEVSLPSADFPGLLELDLSGSLYEILDREYARAPRSAVEHIEPAVADAEQAKLLGICENEAMMRITRTASDARGRAVEFSRDHFRADRIRITVRSSADHAASLEAAGVSTVSVSTT